MLLLCGYANGHRRLRTGSSKTTRHPQWLPEPGWFLDKVRSVGLEPELRKVSGVDARNALDVVAADVKALIVLAPGVCDKGRLTPWNQEAELLWQYYKCPRSSFSVKAVSMYAFEQPSTIASVRGCSGNVAIKHMVFQTNTAVVSRGTVLISKPAGARTTLEECCRKHGLDALVDNLDDVPVMWVPEVVLQLMLVQKWSTLLLNVRNHHLQKGLDKTLAWMQAALNFPSQADLQQLKQQNRDSPAQPTRCLEAQDAMFLLHMLRSQADTLLSECAEFEEDDVRLQLENAAEGLELLILSCHEAGQGQTAANIPKPVLLLTNAIRFSRYVRNRSKMNGAFSSMIEVFVRLDAAFAMLQRDDLESGLGPLFCWADSSPQLGADWLLSIYDFIFADQVVRCWEAANLLSTSVNRFKLLCDGEDGESLESVEGMQSIVQERVDATVLLSKQVRRHRQMPMALGSSASTLEHKTKALAMKFAHEARSLSSLEQIASRVYSLTVDLGTEAGVSDAAGSICDYLPSWVQVDRLLPDAGLDPGILEDTPTHAFMNAFLCAGLDHISNNLQSDMDAKLRNWSTWLRGFKALAHLLSHRYLLKRLVARCISGGPFAALARCFETAVPSVAKWRWGTIVKALPPILALVRPLRIVWDASKYRGRASLEAQAAEEEPGAENREAQDELDADVVTETLKSPLWLPYAHMLLQLHKEWLLSSEDDNLDGSGQSKHAQAVAAFLSELGLPKDSDGPKCVCPLAGKRAHELATGVLQERLRSFCEKVRPEVIIQAAPLDAADKDKVIQDFEHGLSHIDMTVELKLGQWDDFPWKLCSLAVPCANQRRQAAATILEAFEKLPQEQHYHHRITWRFLAPGSELEQQLRRLADDANVSLKDLPQLQYEIACLRFIPVVERVVEAEHSLVHRHGGYRKVTGAYISCAERLQEIDKCMQDEQKKQQLLAAFEKTRKVRRLAKLFRFAKHPQWLEMVSKPKKQQRGLDKMANAIMYGNDTTMLYLDLSAPQRNNRDSRLIESSFFFCFRSAQVQ
ncbi:unnamed protein product [Symbiodinium sp. CCMP2592]|nr:unnamed protein product [Symbiodinium sp. CCMP2592]